MSSQQLQEQQQQQQQQQIQEQQQQQIQEQQQEHHPSTVRRFVQSMLPSHASSSRPTTLVSGENEEGSSAYMPASNPPLTEPSRSANASPRPGISYKRSSYREALAQAINKPPKPIEIITTNVNRQRPPLIAEDDKLGIFRAMIGIDVAPGMADSTMFGAKRRHGTNIGIYGRVVKLERRNKRSYKLFSTLINVCLGLQLVVAAALTALGAGNGPRGLVTAFGAINTVIAGFLTYLKGSGLPHKIKYYANEWEKVREAIEQFEREFCRENCGLDVHDVVNELERMYDDVKSDIEVNASDGIVNQAGGAKSALKRGMSHMKDPKSRAAMSSVDEKV